MLIFTLPSWYKSERYPENSIFIYEQMTALEKIGHKIVILSVQPIAFQSKVKPISEIKKVIEGNIITYYTEISVVAPALFRELYVISFRKALNRLIGQAMVDCGRPDIFYAHFTFAAGYSAIDIAEKIKVPLVVEEHYSGLMVKKLDKKLQKYLSETVKRADKFICVSEGLRQSVYEKTGEEKKIVVISNMINPCFQYSMPILHDNFVFFSCGSLISRKGFDFLIEAFAEEFADEPSVILNIAGSGVERERLLKLIRKSNMESQIRLVGQLNRVETLEEYKNCDCFVLPSRAETYGLVYREALAVGRPIISTKHGGFGAEDWHNDYGYLINIDEKEELKKSMRNLYTNYEVYDLKQISKICLKSCSSDAVAKSISDLFSAINIL